MSGAHYAEISRTGLKVRVSVEKKFESADAALSIVSGGHDSMGGAQARLDYYELFGDAAIDPSKWPSALSTMAEATGSSRGQLIGIGSPRAIPFNWVTDFPTDAAEQLRVSDGYNPNTNFRVLAGRNAADGAIITENEYKNLSRDLARDTYYDFCRDHQIEFGCQANLATSNGSLVGLTVLRSDADGITTTEQRREFKRAVKAAQVAVRLQVALEQQGTMFLCGAFEAINVAALLLDGAGHILALTPQAEHQLSLVGIDRQNHCLSSSNPNINRAIAKAINDVVSRTVSAREVPVADGVDIDFYILPTQEWNMSLVPKVIGVVRDYIGMLEARARGIAKSCQLSPAELAVGMLIAKGASRLRIAAERGVSAETLKSQLKSIYQKTGCSREVELAALLMGTRSIS